MMKAATKPISQKPFALVVIALYFFPQLLALLFITAGRPQGMVIALSVSAISFFSIFLFMRLKKWEDDYKRVIVSLSSESQEDSEGNSESLRELILLRDEKQKLCDEKILLQKQIEEMKLLCEQESQEKQAEVKRVQESLVQARKACESELIKKEEELVALKAELLEATLQKKIYEEKIEVLQQEVSNLKFEIKTILKVIAAEK